MLTSAAGVQADDDMSTAHSFIESLKRAIDLGPHSAEVYTCCIYICTSLLLLHVMLLLTSSYCMHKASAAFLGGVYVKWSQSIISSLTISIRCVRLLCS
jgi:hypothetical protein